MSNNNYSFLATMPPQLWAEIAQPNIFQTSQTLDQRQGLLSSFLTHPKWGHNSSFWPSNVKLTSGCTSVPVNRLLEKINTNKTSEYPNARPQYYYESSTSLFKSQEIIVKYLQSTMEKQRGRWSNPMPPRASWATSQVAIRSPKSIENLKFPHKKYILKREKPNAGENSLRI